MRTMTKRTTRSISPAAGDKKRQFKAHQGAKSAAGSALTQSRSDTYLWRDEAGRVHDIFIPDPVVKPKGTTVREIRQAFKKAAGSSAGRKR
jgi:hypothetical protein